MANIKEAMLTCANCGEEFKIETYESVNVTLERDLKEKVMNKSIFEFTCPKCGKFHRVVYPFLYVDMEKNLLVYLADKETNLNDLKDQALIQATDFLHTYKCRAVVDMHEMREKILLDDLGLNDKVVEVLKLFAVTQSNVDREQLHRTYFAGIVNECLQFDMVMIDNSVKSGLVPMIGYENVYNVDRSYFDKKDDKWVQVDIYYALDFLDTHKELA